MCVEPMGYLFYSASFMYFWMARFIMYDISGHRLSVKIKLTLIIILKNAYAQEMNAVVVLFLYCELQF
jgi:hypothetical protein